VADPGARPGASPGAWPGADRFIRLYALAWAGGTIAYMPLLSILLPGRVAKLAGTTAGVDWLAAIALAGALAASAGGIAFGWLSDITRNRRGWIAAGLALSTGLLLLIGTLESLPALIGAIILWQLALNMMLGPLSAWAADMVPDDRKGLLGGLMAFAPGVGALAGTIVTLPGLAAHQGRLQLVALMVVAAVLPILIARHPVPAGRPNPPVAAPPGSARRTGRAALVRLWFARLAVQIAEATLFAYLFFWLVRLDDRVVDHDSARLFTLVMFASVPVALGAGRWSDRRGRPMVPLFACALLAAAGLGGMALATAVPAALLAYGLFGVSGAVFLALHSAQTMRFLPRPDRRGRDLGLFNLANTLPSLVMPLLAVSLIPLVGFSGLFALLALLAAVAALLLAGVARGG
jgi:MFS family permease